MTDEEYEKQAARLRVLLGYWRGRRLCLMGWRIDHYYHRAASEMPGDSTTRGVVARVFPKWVYKYAEVHWDISQVATLDDDALEQDFVHEMMHCHLQGIGHKKGWQLENEERIATDLAQAFVFLRYNVDEYDGETTEVR